MLESIELPLWGLELVIALVLLSAVVVIMLERREPSATLAWILLILLLPVFGLLLYVFFGRRSYRRVRRQARRRPVNVADSSRQLLGIDELPHELEEPQRGLVQLALKASAAPLRCADRVSFIAAGDVAWQSIEGEIFAARESIHLEFYIWRDDEAGRRLVAALADRARTGIEVRILYDPLGSLGLTRSHFAPLVEVGGEVATSGRIFSRRFGRIRANYRNHRKLISIDRRVGFLGGINIAREYLIGGQRDGVWRDLIVRLEGDAVRSIDSIFQEDWLDATGELLGDDARVRSERHARTRSSDIPVQIIPSGPDARLGYAISAQINAAIASATDRCWIATPYLIPDQALKLTLTTTAMRGVDLRILIPRRSDNLLVTYAARSYLDTLLQAGCRVFEYPQMLHAKYLIVDDSLASVGSANMDIRSFQLNYEVTAMFYSDSVNAELAEIFAQDLEPAHELSIEGRRNIGALDRVAESAARLLSPLL